ncbi:hypothetical protein M413DRAFT_449138, partial [Hebeloma cylindrosporum]
MSGRDHAYSDPRWAHSGRDPRSEGQTSQPRPSRDDDRRPIGYNPSGSAPYQVAPAQPPYHQVPIQYPTSHLPPHGGVPVQAFPPQRAPTHPYHAQGPYGPPFQPQPPPGGAPTLWHPPPASIANTESGNTENSNIGGSYNNNSTRTDHRVNAQVAAHMSNTQTVFIQNLHVSPTGHAPAAIPSGAFPSAVSPGQSAHPMDNLTTQMRETTITSSERRYDAYFRVPPADEDPDNCYPDQSRSKKSKTRSSTVPIPKVKDEYDYTQGQRGYPGEGSSRPTDQRGQRSRHDPQDTSRVESSKGERPSRKSTKDVSSSRRQTSRVRETDEEDYEVDDEVVAGSYRSEGVLSKSMSHQSWVPGQSVVSGNPSETRETTPKSSERRYESHSRVPPDDEDFENRYPDQSRSKKSKTRSSTMPVQQVVEDEYDYTQGQRGYPGEGSSRPADPRVPHSSRRPSHSVLQPMVQDRHDYPSHDPRSSSYTSSSSQRHQRREEDSSDDSSSGDETASPSSHSRKPRRKGDIKSKTSFIAPRSSLDTYHGSSEPSGLSTSNTAAHSSRSPPNPTTSIPSRNEEENAPYSTRASGWGSSQSSEPSYTKAYEPSHTKPYNPFSSPDTTGPPHYDAPYSHPSSNPSGSHHWGGQPTGPPPGWSAPHPGSMGVAPMRGSQSYSSGDKDPRTLNVAGYPPMQRRLTDIVESQVYNPSQQTLAYRIQPLGNPCLMPFIKGKGNENLGVKRSDDSHIPLYMCSNIIDPDSVALWFPAPTLFPPGGGRRGVELGDLGYFDDAGELRPIFNIFHSYEQNLAEGARPPDPPYQPLRIDFRSVVRQVDIQRQQTYTSSNIERPQEAGSHPATRYQFRTYKQSGRSGAIIVLPHGGSSVCIRNSYFQLPEVKQHFREHAPSWYQHALRLIGKKANGSLVLVRATHCAKTWGIAAFASKRDIREPLYATFLSNPANEYQHMWQTNDNRWKTSTGPSLEELGEFRGREPPLNQCIGVVISSLRLDDATWQTNFGSTWGLPSGPDRSSGSWSGSLRRVFSGDSWSTIHVNENSGRTTRRLLDSIRGRTVDMRHMGVGD